MSESETQDIDDLHIDVEAYDDALDRLRSEDEDLPTKEERELVEAATEALLDARDNGEISGGVSSAMFMLDQSSVLDQTTISDIYFELNGGSEMSTGKGDDGALDVVRDHIETYVIDGNNPEISDDLLGQITAYDRGLDLLAHLEVDGEASEDDVESILAEIDDSDEFKTDPGKVREDYDRALARRSQLSDDVEETTLYDGRIVTKVTDDVHECEGKYGNFYPAKKPEDNDGEFKPAYFDPWSSFTLEVEEFLIPDDGADDEKVRLTIIPADESAESFEVTVSATVFKDHRAFQREVAKRTSTRFEPRNGERRRMLEELVARSGAVRRQGVDQLGLHLHDNEEADGLGEFVTPAGSIGPDGWVEDASRVFNGRTAHISESWSLDPEDGSEFDADEIARILELLPRTRDPERFLPVLGWFYSAPLRPWIMSQTSEFNVLNVLGDTGVGKTSTLEVLAQMLGMSPESEDAGSTPASLRSAFGETTSIPLWLDEFKPAEFSNEQKTELKRLIRTSTKGGRYGFGRKDMSADGFTISAPVCVSGEQAVTGSAEERRTILSTFRLEPVTEWPESRRAFAELVGSDFETEDGDVERFDGLDLDQHALAYYRFISGLDSDTLTGVWQSARDRVSEVLRDVGALSDLKDLERQGLQLIVFGCELYRAFAREMGLDPGTVITHDEVDHSLRYVIDDHGREKAGHSTHLDRFIELVSLTASAESIEYGEDYTFIKPRGSSRYLLAFRLNEVYGEVSRYVRSHGLRDEDLLGSAKDYRKRINEGEDSEGSYVEASSAMTTIGRAVRIDIGYALETIEGFDLAPFDGIEAHPEMLDALDIDEDGMSHSVRPLERHAAHTSAPQADRIKAIREFVGERDGASRGAIIAGLLTDGFDEGEITGDIETLRRQGDLMPADGVLTLT